MKKPEPIFLVPLLSKIDKKLIQVLKSLSIEDWALQSIAPQWTVKDIAVHLLDGNLRTLSMLRDNYAGDPPGDIQSHQDLLDYLNRLNADWVQAMKRLSPKVLIDLLERSGQEYCEYLASLDPFDKATFSVGWAGEAASKNWFHIAREYTEKYHHQQQIRLAVGAEAELLTEEWILPYLETSVRALPYHYRSIQGAEGDLIEFTFSGERDKSWFLKWEEQAWKLGIEAEEQATSQVRIKDAISWRLFTKGIDRQKARELSENNGDHRLGDRIFELTAVMA